MNEAEFIQPREDGSILVRYVPEGFILVNTKDGTYIPSGRKAGFKNGIIANSKDSPWVLVHDNRSGKKAEINLKVSQTFTNVESLIKDKPSLEELEIKEVLKVPRLFLKTSTQEEKLIVERTGNLLYDLKEVAGEVLDLITLNKDKIYKTITNDPTILSEAAKRGVNLLEVFEEIEKIHNFYSLGHKRKFNIKYFVEEIVPKIELVDRLFRNALFKMGDEIHKSLDVQIYQFNGNFEALQVYYKLNDFGTRLFFLSDSVRKIINISEDKDLPDPIKVSALQDYLALLSVKQRIFTQLNTKIAEYSPKYFSERHEEDLMEEAKKMRLLEICVRELEINAKEERPQITKVETLNDSVKFYISVYDKLTSTLKRNAIIEVKEVKNLNIRERHNVPRDEKVKIPAHYGLHYTISSIISSPQQDFRVLLVETDLQNGKTRAKESEYVHFMTNFFTRTSRFGFISVLLKTKQDEEDGLTRGLQKKREKFLQKLIDKPLTIDNLKNTNPELYKSYKKMLEAKLTTGKVPNHNPGIFHSITESIVVGELANFLNQTRRELPIEQKIEELQDLMFRTAFGRTLFLTPEQKEKFGHQFHYERNSLPKITIPGFISLSLQFISSLAEKFGIYSVPRFDFTFEDKEESFSNNISRALYENNTFKEFLAVPSELNRIFLDRLEKRQNVDKQTIYESIKNYLPKLKALQNVDVESLAKEVGEFIANHFNKQMDILKRKYPQSDLRRAPEYGEVIEDVVHMFFSSVLDYLAKANSYKKYENKNSLMYDFGDECIVFEKNKGTIQRGIGDIRFYIYDKKTKKLTPILLEVKSTSVPRIQNFMSVYEIFVSLASATKILLDAGIDLPQRFKVNNPKVYTFNMMKNPKQKDIIFEFPSKLEDNEEQYEEIKNIGRFRTLKYRYSKMFHFSLYGASLYIPEKEIANI